MYGCGSRIWTYDLRVMSPTSYQTALSRVIGAEDRNRTDTVFNHRRILSPVRLPVPPPRHLAPRVGLEPTAYRLTAECSTIELPRIITTPKSGVRFLKFDYFFFENLMFSMSDASNEEILNSLSLKKISEVRLSEWNY